MPALFQKTFQDSEVTGNVGGTRNMRPHTRIGVQMGFPRDRLNYFSKPTKRKKLESGRASDSLDHPLESVSYPFIT